MEPKGSLQFTQQPATFPNPEADYSVYIISPHFFKINFNIIFPLTSRSLTKILHASFLYTIRGYMRCPSHHPLLDRCN
jgi:hypothetical protein